MDKFLILWDNSEEGICAYDLDNSRLNKTLRMIYSIQ